jgi:signal transduction histidine kinase
MIWLALAAGAAAGWAARLAFERRALHRRGRMLSFVAHELNTPLTAVNMTVLNFLSGIFGTMPRDQQDWMLMVKEQLVRLNGLVGELRDFIHLEFQRDLRIRTEPTDLQGILKMVLSQTEGTVTRSGARLDVKIQDDLPPVQADPERVQRVLASVLAHARKFRKDGPISVSAFAEGGAGEVRIAFTSNTPLEGDPERILELYYPISGGASSQLLSSVGTGLGLCRVLVEHQGGTLRVASDGAATEIRLRLPLVGSGPKMVQGP